MAMKYGRLIKVTPPSSNIGHDEGILYVVAAEDPNEAVRLVRYMAVIGSDIEVVGRVSHQLLAALQLEPGQFTRA